MQPGHLQVYLGEFVFRFRRTARERGLLFLRLLEHTTAAAPALYRDLVIDHQSRDRPHRVQVPRRYQRAARANRSIGYGEQPRKHVSEMDSHFHEFTSHSLFSEGSVIAGGMPLVCGVNLLDTQDGAGSVRSQWFDFLSVQCEGDSGWYDRGWYDRGAGSSRQIGSKARDFD